MGGMKLSIPSWGFVAAAALCVVSLFLLARTSRPFLDRFYVDAFAHSQATAQGLDGWPLDSKSDDGAGGFRFLYRNPADKESFADLQVSRHNGKWAVDRLNKDFRPWQNATASH